MSILSFYHCMFLHWITKTVMIIHALKWLLPTGATDYLPEVRDVFQIKVGVNMVT